jgi:phenylacetic acid degradation operon negative regulatory protein
VASTLLGVRPPRLPTGVLVRSGTLFGIADGTTRVAVSRMVGAGELEPDGDGYRLAGHLLARLDRQDLSRHGVIRPWTGDWRVAVVVADARPSAERVRLRAAMAQLRLAELREGVWLRPDNLPGARLASAEAVVAEQCRWFRGQPGLDATCAANAAADADADDLAASLWDLDGWADRANALRSRLAVLRADLEAQGVGVLAPAFVAAASALRHLQADPLLPPELLPPDWPGAALRADHERYDATFLAVWRDWLHAQQPTGREG